MATACTVGVALLARALFICSLSNGGFLVSRTHIARSCAVVFTLPAKLTATMSLSPDSAIHSRSAVMPISRHRIHTAGAATTIPHSAESKTSAVATMSLSATGSRNAPKRDERFILRARKPSSQSVAAAPMNSALRKHGEFHESPSSGIATTRDIVRTFGRVQSLGAASPDPVAWTRWIAPGLRAGTSDGKPFGP